VELPSVICDPRDFVHDSHLASYEVDCEQRVIRIHASYPRDGQEPIRTDILFTGVQAYHLEHDAFGNLIFEFDEIPAAELYQQQAAYISESYRNSGSPGPWAETLEKALAHLAQHGIKGFVLGSSYGMRGWILAQQIEYIRV
jgi:hypothetical protein